MWGYSFFLKQAVMFGCLLKEGCSHILHTQYGFYDGMYSGVKKECDLVAQNAKNSLIWLVHKASLLIGLTSLDCSQKSVFSIFLCLSGIIFTWKLYQKISLIFLNPMIVFVCGNHQENKNGSTFSFSKIGNTCIKIVFQTEGISDLHLVKLPPIYIFI